MSRWPTHRAAHRTAIVAVGMSVVMAIFSAACTNGDLRAAKRSDGVFGWLGGGASLPEDCAELSERVTTELNGMRAQETDHTLGISLQYRPALLQACITSGEEASLEDSVLTQEAQALANGDAFIIRLPRTGLKNGHSVDDALLFYVQHRASVDLVELVDGDSVRCAFVHVESTPAMGPHHTVLVAFDHPQDRAERTVLWKDSEQLLGGDLTFRFEKGLFSEYQTLISSSLAATPDQQ